jgi:hypothetical protein
VFYEDCVRDADLVMGSDILTEVGPALGLVLTSARWYTHEVAVRYRALLTSIYESIVAETGDSTVEYLRFWRSVEPHFAGAQTTDAVVDIVQAELHARWRRALTIDGSECDIVRPVEEVSGAVQHLFAAPAPGWPTARFHSPDLLIAAPDIEAIRRGHFFAVLGELHAGVNTLAKPLMYALHPEADALVRASERDIEVGRVARPETKDSFMTQRLGHCSFSAQDVQLATGRTRGFRPEAETVRAADLQVTKDATGAVRIVTRDRLRSFDVVAFFEEHLRYKSTTRFSILPAFSAGADRSPRVTVGRLVFSHARWRYPTRSIPFHRERSPHARFVAARRWALAQKMPRFVFAKTPNERKPYFLDFASPTCVELTSRLLRQSETASFAEMLPTPSDCWLRGSRGDRFTSEIRVAAVDPIAWPPPSLQAVAP